MKKKEIKKKELKKEELKFDSLKQIRGGFKSGSDLSCAYTS